MKEQAEFYRLALLLGLLTKADVIAWCDSTIISEEEPDVAIIEASVAGSEGVDAVAAALSDVKGESDKSAVTSQIFGFMHNLLDRDRSQAPKVARQLYRMAMDDIVADETACAQMYGFWEDIDLAREGIYGDEKELTEEMLRFLRLYSTT